MGISWSLNIVLFDPYWIGLWQSTWIAAAEPSEKISMRKNMFLRNWVGAVLVSNDSQRNGEWDVWFLLLGKTRARYPQRHKNMILVKIIVDCVIKCPQSWLIEKLKIKDRIFEHRENRNLIIMEARSLCLCVCHFSKWLIMAVMLSDWLSGSVCELKLMARFFSPKIPDTCQPLPAIETKDRILNQLIWAGEFKQFRGQVCNFEILGQNKRWKKTSHNGGSHVHYVLRQ